MNTIYIDREALASCPSNWVDLVERKRDASSTQGDKACIAVYIRVKRSNGHVNKHVSNEMSEEVDKVPNYPA